MQENTKKHINYKKLGVILMVMAAATAMFAFPALAATVNANTVMTNLINLMCSMFKYVGAAVFVWAIIQFVLATKRSDADSKADAIQTAVCGIALMGIAVIVSAMGIGSAIDGDDKFDDSTLGSMGGGN